MFSPALCNLVTVFISVSVTTLNCVQTLFLENGYWGGRRLSLTLAWLLWTLCRGQGTANRNAKSSCTDIKGSHCAKQPPFPPKVVKGEAWAWADITASLSGLEDKTGCGVSSSSLCAVSIGCLVSAPPVSDHMLHPPQSPRLPCGSRLESPCQVSHQALPTSRAPRS